MKLLQTLEHQFQNYLMYSNREIMEHIVSTDKVGADVRLDIYAYAYRSRLHEALTTNYPVLAAYLGCESFQNLCYAYIDKHPSQYRSIRWFGDQLAGFLSSDVKYQSQPYLAELAQLEWTMCSVFDAADGTVFPLESMAAIPPDAWEDMRLQVHPTVRRLALAWNVVQIWENITDGKDPAAPTQNEHKVDFIFWRKDLRSHFSALAVDEAWAIDAASDGKTFGEICEGLFQWNAEEELGLRAASLLKSWITAGLIGEIDTITHKPLF